MKKIDYFLLLVLIVLACGLRLYKIDTPLSDLHSWRQADTAAVARNYARNGIDLLKPRYDDLSSIQSGIENPEGLRYVEFPMYNAIVGAFNRYLPITSITIYGRLVSAVFSLITLACLYYLLLVEKNRVAAFFGSLLFASFPYFVFFSRTVLPETTAVSFMMLSLIALYAHLTKNQPLWRSYLLYALSIVFYACSILVKPTTIFYSIAIAYLFLSTLKLKAFTTWKTYAFVIVGLLPFAWWRMFIQQFPAGIPASDWLFTTVNTFEGPKNIFFKPAFFRWMFMERIGQIMLGTYLAGVATIGAIAKQKRFFLLSIAASAMVYMFVFQGGNVQHEYYQIIMFPGIAVMVGLGVAALHDTRVVHKMLFYPAMLAIFIVSFLFSWYRVEGYYHNPADLTSMAELIDSFTKPTDRIVTDRSGDTTLLYLADRKGAPAIYKDIPTLEEMGYSYLVTDNDDLSGQLKEQDYDILFQNDQFSLIKLKNR
ncbi:glycosyltransferase family 39 protein [Candidatus Woesebacteria bacterium]|nr:glycosyltransferase family 39 protein [Candidatus Woesebacteria bacterium]